MSSRASILFASLALMSSLALSGCNHPPPPAQSANAEAENGSDFALPPFVGKVWMSTTWGQPRGSIRIFLPNKTLLMDSCFETFRIVEWGMVSEDTIRWREDVVPVEAKFTQPTPATLRLKIAGIEEEQTYAVAEVPYLCPDMPR